MQRNILVLGSNGMLGHMLIKYIKTLAEFTVYSTKRDKNLQENEFYYDAYKDFEKIKEIISKVNPELVINCIGIVPKMISNENKEMTSFINSKFPHKLAELCKNNSTKLIHISTDCVFSGKERNYTENSPYSPVDFYGESKAKGEINDNNNLTIRTSIMGPEIKQKKNGLMEWLFSQEKVKGFKNAIWSGLTTLELSKKIIELHEKNITGIINVASAPISKYDLLNLIKQVYDLNIEIIPEGKFHCNRSMKTIRTDVYEVPSHEQMLKELKEFN